MKKIILAFFAMLLFTCVYKVQAQSDSTAHNQPKRFKNIIRYNLSSPLLFGFDKCIIFGYERQLKNNQSFSFNFGRAAIPQLITIVSDSSSLKKGTKNTGVNFSLDYRFYLNKENRYAPPHGVYIGPYYAFTKFQRDNDHYFTRSSGNIELAKSYTDFTINNMGFELGYQFVLFKRLAVDMVLIGPGFSSYHVNAKLDGNLNPKDKIKMRDDIREMLTQKLPGLKNVLGDKEFDVSGVMQNWNIGYRYLVHIGYTF